MQHRNEGPPIQDEQIVKRYPTKGYTYPYPQEQTENLQGKVWIGFYSYTLEAAIICQTP